MSALLLGPEEAAIEFWLLSFVSKFQITKLLHPLSINISTQIISVQIFQ